MEPDVEELAVLPELDDPDAAPEVRNKLQGTATCLPELDELEALGLVAEAFDAELDELDPAELFREITAKSTFPEFGLMMTSWIVPRVSPEEP